MTTDINTVLAIHVNDLTPAQHRVRLAYDVILRIQTKQLRAAHMTYFTLAWDEDVNECEVCAQGALAVAYFLERNESVRIFPHADNDEQEQFLASIFSFDQLRRIEAAFETWPAYPEDRLGRDLTEEEHRINDAVMKYIPMNREEKRLETAETTLIRICQNIIDNDGDFVL